jgi:hypothetical protein
MFHTTSRITHTQPHLDVAVDEVLAVEEGEGREQGLDHQGGSLNLWELAALQECMQKDDVM